MHFIAPSLGVFKPKNSMETQPEIQQRIAHQRIQHIVDSYSLADDPADAFASYLSELIKQYPPGLIELALVQTLVKNWLRVPMKKGVSFLLATQDQLNQWQLQAKETRLQSSLTPSQFEQITGLDPTGAFVSLIQPVLPTAQPTQATTE
jgi:hypothetical protein